MPFVLEDLKVIGPHLAALYFNLNKNEEIRNCSYFQAVRLVPTFIAFIIIIIIIRRLRSSISSPPKNRS